MLIATFGPSTGWAGRQITFEDDAFMLEGYGPLSPADVREYDRQGHLTWANDATRAWVESTAVASQPSQTTSSGKTTTPSGGVPIGTSSVATGSRPRSGRAVDIERVSRGDWVVVAGFLGLTIGAAQPWYGSTLYFDAARWVSTASWLSTLSWLAGLAATVVIVLSSGVVPKLHVDMGSRVPFIVMGLGAFGVLLVAIGLVTEPSHNVGFQAGIVFSLLGAAAVVVGGFLKTGESIPEAAPLTASEVMSNAVQTAKVAFAAARTAVKTQSSGSPGSPAAPPTPIVATTPSQTGATTLDAPRPLPISAPSTSSTAAATTSTDRSAVSVVDELAKLADLREKGLLTDEEFASFKAKLME